MSKGNKSVLRICLLTFLISLCFASAVSAFTVTGMAVSPSGDLKPGDAVTVTFNVVFDETFPVDDTLQLQTDLDNAKWTTTVVLNGVDNPRSPQTGKNIYMRGWDLSYAKGVEAALRVGLDGVVPSVSSSQNKTIVKIQELGKTNQPISSTIVTVSRLIISSTEINQNIADRQAELNTFRQHIDEKAAIDVDVSAAEAKYSAAKIAIDSAKGASASQYSAAIKNLGDAHSLIADGEVLLDKAWAQKAINDAMGPIAKVDEQITYFKVNRSMGSDPRLSPVITVRESAAQYLSSANDLFTQGNYAQARIKANEAFDKGNQSYTDALFLRKELGEGGGNPLEAVTKPLGANWKYILVGVGVVIVIIGVLYWRSRSRWDELG